MLVSKAAHRYAKALLEITQEDGITEKILADMTLIRDTVMDNKELYLVLRSPIIKYDDKLAILKQIFDDKVQTITSQLIVLLSGKKRENILHQVAEAFILAYNVSKGIMDVEVMSAKELDQKQIDSLRKALESKLDKTVDLSVSTDEALMGGIAVKIGDTIIDGTVKHQLERLQDKLMETA